MKSTTEQRRARGKEAWRNRQRKIQKWNERNEKVEREYYARQGLPENGKTTVNPSQSSVGLDVA